MRRRAAVLALLALAGSGFSAWLGAGSFRAPVMSIVSNTSSGTVMDVEVPGVNVETRTVEGTAYDAISIPGEVPAALDVGKPQVPKLSYLLGIPDHAQISVTVTVLETRTFDNVNCFPCQTPATDNETRPFVVDRAFYAQDVNYPLFDARVMNTGIWRDLAVGNIQVYPVHYDPRTRRLVVYTRIRVSVSYSGGIYVRKTIPSWLARTYARYIDNFGRLDIKPVDQDSDGVKYLVISHDNWYNDPFLVDSLLGWQYKRGVNYRLIHKASWTPDEIRDSVLAEYSRHSPAQLRWVLLVGEYAEIPEYTLGDNIPGDYYYSDILPSTPDNYPEIGLSRLSPQDAGDLHNQILKILKYEKNPPSTSDWLTKHALIACADSYPNKYSGCIRGICNEPMAWYRYNFDTLMCHYHGNDSIQRLIEEGRGVVTYRGHGDWDEWYTEASQGGAPWYVSNVAALNNGDLTPMVFNICCYAGEISMPTCLSEEWMRKYPGGAVGSLAATQPSYTLPNHGICSTEVRCLCDTWAITAPGGRNYALPTFDIGWIQCNIDAYVAKYWPGSPYPDNIYMYLNLGDPAMECWSGGTPVTPEVSYPDTVPVGPYDLPVTVQASGRPVKGALVCAWKEPDFHVIGHTDEFGQVTLSINSVSSDSFYVTASSGHVLANPPVPILPFEGTCLARSSNSAYVIHYRHTIDDAPPGGNGDSIVNPGETIAMPTWVKNYGAVTGSSITGKLRTDDVAATVTDSTKAFGDIPAGDSGYTGSDGFKFHVGDTCTNGHNIPFTLVCRDVNDSVWTSTLSVRVGTPVMNYAGRRIYDPRPGGNNNGRLDPGEDAQLSVFLCNSGLGNGYDVSATLRSGDSRFLIIDSLGAWGAVLRDSTAENQVDQFAVHADSAIPPQTAIPCTLHVLAAGNYSVAIVFTVVVSEIRPSDPVPDNNTPAPLYWAYDRADSDYVEAPQFNWIEASGRGTQLLLGDDSTVTIQLPAAFGPLRYYSDTFTQLSVCSNGFIMPGSQAYTAWSNEQLPGSPSVPVPIIAGVWTDLDPSAGGSVWHFLDTLNHCFVVEWDSVPYWNQAIEDKWEILFYDTTRAAPDGRNRIVVQYLTANNYVSMTAGIQGTTPSIGIGCLYNGTYNQGTTPITPGSAIEYVTIVPATGISNPVTPSCLRNVSFAVYPNPFRDRVRIRCQIPVAGRVSLRVLDVTGREVAEICDRQLAANAYTFTWDGSSCNGRAVAAGVYFYQLEAPTVKLTRKVTLLR
jgi:hypothetical protein